MQQLPYPVWLLAAAQALGMCAAPMIILIGGIIGVGLAPSPEWATLPIASIVIGSATASIPAAMIMKRVGRRMGFIGATLVALLGSILAYSSIQNSNFWGLCFSIGLLGIHVAFVAQFRFAALEWVDGTKAAQAASVVLLGGLIAAFVGPEIGIIGKGLFSQAFSGSFVLLACIYCGLLVLLWIMPFADMKQSDTTSAGRPIRELIKLPSIGAAIAAGAIGYGVMSLIMTATPVSMTKIQSFALEESKTVIQSHILAMFLPSLFTAYIFKLIGLRGMMLTGLIAMCIAMTVALVGQSYLNYWFALVFLGIGWNFLYVSGTALLTQSYEQQESFKMQAVNEGFVFSFQASMSLLSGWLVFQFGWFALNISALLILLIALGFIGRWLIYERKAAMA